MAKRPPACITLVAAVFLCACPAALTAPAASPTVSSTAVDDQTGTNQIAVDNPLCFQTGMRLLNNGSNAVEAAVGTLLCLGVVNFQSSGIGGGAVMVVAEKDPNGGKPSVTVIDGRSVAPISATHEVYEADSALARTGKNGSTCTTIDFCKVPELDHMLIVPIPGTTYTLLHSQNMYISCPTTT